MLKFVKELISRYGEDNISGKAAALAYFAIFSIGPLLFIVFGILGLVLQDDAVKARILDQVNQTIGPQTQPFIKNLINGHYLSGGVGISFLIGIIGLVLAAIGIFGQLKRAFNEILKVKVGPGAGIKDLFVQRFISLGLVGVICFLLLASLLASTAIAVITSGLNNSVIPGPTFTIIDFLVSVVILSLLLAILYRTLPDARLPGKLLIVTSLIVAVLFGAGRIVLSHIISHNATVSAFGTAASLVAFLLWIFYSGQLIFLGVLGASIYAEGHQIELMPRYKAYKGVFRVSQATEPMGRAPLTVRIEQKFEKGLKKGWRRNKK
jgi:membrane protein